MYHFHVGPAIWLVDKIVKAKCDGIVATGTEGGGHQSYEMITTLVLLQQVIRKYPEKMIIACGGIASPEGVAACIGMGADAVAMGTRFIASNQSEFHPNYKDLIPPAQARDTMLTTGGFGPIRLLKNKYCLEHDKLLSKEEKIAQELLGDSPQSKYSLLGIYTSEKDNDGYRMKKVNELPVIMLTIEEAPSILGSHMSKEGNVFIDISRQGRKFRMGLLLITQNISAMEPIILANTNTEINMMLGNDIEIKQAIMNASNNISGYEHEFKVLSRGEAILTNSLKNIPLSVKIRNVPKYIEKEISFFSDPYKSLNIKRPKKRTETPLF